MSLIDLNKTRYNRLKVNCGIYVLIIGNGVYIGKTTRSFKQRLLEHRNLLNTNSHYSDELQQSYNKRKRLLFISLVNIPINSHFNEENTIVTLENLFISSFRLIDLLNSCSYRANPKILKVLEKNGNFLLEQYESCIPFVNELLEIKHLEIEDIRKLLGKYSYLKMKGLVPIIEEPYDKYSPEEVSKRVQDYFKKRNLDKAA
jgi:hypothetical protein